MAVQWVIHCFIWRRAQLVDACLVVVQLHNQLTLVEMLSELSDALSSMGDDHFIILLIDTARLDECSKAWWCHHQG